MKIIAFITNPYLARHILVHLKLSTNPFDPLPPIPKEWENESQLIPTTPDGFASMDEPEVEYQMSQLIPGTRDGFPEEFYDSPWVIDSS